jgi:hydrogenase maturation protease
MNCDAVEPRSPPLPADGRVLVVGYGNTLRGDDAFGPIVAERLRALVAPDRVLVIACHQLTPELAADVAACQQVIFIDASAASPPGELVCRTLDAGDASAAGLVHSLGPDHLLVLARLIYGRAPPATLVTAGGANFELGDHRLSPLVAAAIEPAVEHIRQQIDSNSSTLPRFAGTGRIRLDCV